MVAVLYHPGGMVVVIIKSNRVPGDCGNQPAVIAVAVLPFMPVPVAIIVGPIPKISMISAALMAIVVPGIIGSIVGAATNSKRNLAVTASQCRCAK